MSNRMTVELSKISAGLGRMGTSIAKNIPSYLVIK